MVISNIGTIVLSLPSSSTSGADLLSRIPPTDISTSTQVRLLSLANTTSRLLVGPIADYVSPVASYLHNGDAYYPRKHRVSRVAFLTVAAILYALTCLWMEIGVKSQGALWALRYVWLLSCLYQASHIPSALVLASPTALHSPSCAYLIS